MNTNYWFYPVSVVAFFMLIGLIIIGGKIENDRLYEKCLNSNSSMSYVDVTKMCKELVK